MRHSENLDVMHNKSRGVAFSGVTIAISLLCLILFRGILSIVQVIIIPVVIVMLSIKQSLVYISATVLSLLVLTLIFFPVQTIFVLTYLLLAIFLKIVYLNSNHQPIRRWLFIIIYFFLVGLMLYVGIKLTDIVLGTQLDLMMRQLSQSNSIIYLSIILLEALIISVIHMASLILISRRIRVI